MSAAFWLALGAGGARAGDDSDLLAIGIGHYDHRYIDPDFLFLRASTEKRHYGAVDLRLEYRFDTSLMPYIEDYAKLGTNVIGLYLHMPVERLLH